MRMASLNSIPTQKGLYEPSYGKTNDASGKQKAPHLCKNLFEQVWDTSGLGQEHKTSSTEPFNALPTPPYAGWLIQRLKRIDGTHKEPIHVGMPTEEYCQGWKRTKEKTSAGPLTLHLGHCNVAALDPRIIEFEAEMTSIPMKSGYAYKRWRKGTDVELLKKANSFHVSKLRTIV
jgi:hypothetical protein